MSPVRLFVGLDPNELVGFHVFLQSVLGQTDPNQVEIYPICKTKGDASNTFNQHWTDIPKRCGYRGRAVFVDGCDMLCRADIRELVELIEPGCDVAVVPHEYSTKFPVKFLGHPNEDYPRKNWTSVLVIDAGMSIWRNLDSKIADKPKSYIQRLEFIKDERITYLPTVWNHLVSEYPYDPEAKIAHFTIGGPWWKRYERCDYADEWREWFKKTIYFAPWEESFDDSPMVSER